MEKIELFFMIVTSVLTSIILAAGGYCIAKVKSFSKKQNAIEKGVQALLRDRIIQMFNYYSVKNHMPIYARENVDGLNKEYHALGGNGVINGLVKRLMGLPVDNPEDVDKEDRSVVD